MTFHNWFKQWMQEHPLRVPDEDDSRRFTQDVMRQIRADVMPAHAPAWGGWRLAVALPAFAIATTLIVVTALYLTRDNGPTVVEAAPPTPPATEQVEPVQLAHTDDATSPFEEAEAIVALLAALDEELNGDLSADTLTEALRWIDESDLSS
ncbi:MAG: hypothetical protein HN919_09415 [Verrucomicrobia bacterium]|jgi:hypothetical protein|nr:hypothetical protein [Verrucomicrobiota bacterium]MBT7066507.1 hypothetical protein [Verrucomicrobiota bacterium]MBT7699945.1 hypothetical protein [Verrucomicrobiota bacterium]